MLDKYRHKYHSKYLDERHVRSFLNQEYQSLCNAIKSNLSLPLMSSPSSSSAKPSAPNKRKVFLRFENDAFSEGPAGHTFNTDRYGGADFLLHKELAPSFPFDKIYIESLITANRHACVYRARADDQQQTRLVVKFSVWDNGPWKDLLREAEVYANHLSKEETVPALVPRYYGYGAMPKPDVDLPCRRVGCLILEDCGTSYTQPNFCDLDRTAKYVWSVFPI